MGRFSYSFLVFLDQATMDGPGNASIELIFREIGQAFQVQFVKKDSTPQSESEPGRKQAGTKQAPSKHQVGTKYRVDNNKINILKECKKPIYLVEMMKLLNRTDRTKFRKKVVLPLLENGLLEMTNPGSPNSPKQKYRRSCGQSRVRIRPEAQPESEPRGDQVGTKFRRSLLQPLIRAGLIEITEPDSPKSPTQQYRITEYGRQVLNVSKKES